MTDFRKALADLVVAVGNHPDAMMATGDLHTPFMRACAALESSAVPEAPQKGNYDPNESPEALAARLAQIEVFVRSCEGWRLLPCEADDKMKMAGAWLIRNWQGYVISREDAGAIYKAMLAAAPSVPSPQRLFTATDVEQQLQDGLKRIVDKQE